MKHLHWKFQLIIFSILACTWSFSCGDDDDDNNDEDLDDDEANDDEGNDDADDDDTGDDDTNLGSGSPPPRPPGHGDDFCYTCHAGIHGGVHAMPGDCLNCHQ